MKKLAITVVALVCVSTLAGCGMIKQKAAGYYLDKAHEAVQKQGLTQADVEEAIRLAEKAYSYAKTSSMVVSALEEIASAAGKSGLSVAQEMQQAALARMLTQNPADWSARHAFISLLSSRGDLSGLAEQVLELEKMTFPHDEKGKYCARLALLEATAAAVPWLESEAYLNINKSADAFFEKTYIYSAAADKAADLLTELETLAKKDPALKNSAPKELLATAEEAAAGALRDKDTISRAHRFNNVAVTDSTFKKAMRLTVQGNEALAAKAYAKARACYQGALQAYPAAVYARRQLAETDFQEGAALGAVGESKKAAVALLAGANQGLTNVLGSVPYYGCEFPFVKKNVFLGETHALKAATLLAMRTLEPGKGRKIARMETEFKTSLEEAIKLYPENRMARELSDRYAKEGF